MPPRDTSFPLANSELVSKGQVVRETDVEARA